MHLGSLAVTGVNHPPNLVHIVINNGAHESVGGMPVVSTYLNLSDVALKLGYKHSFRAEKDNDLLQVLGKLKNLDGLVFIEVMSNLESRSDLGRPATTPIQNKDDLMNFLMREI
jgi:phosphonopyruvate decarboxylase